MSVMSRGMAVGGYAAAVDALKLWCVCAVGNADYGNLPTQSPQKFVQLQTTRAAFNAAVELLKYEPADHYAGEWAVDVVEQIMAAATRLLEVCADIEGGDASDARFSQFQENRLVFEWSGWWTNDRWIEVDLTITDTDQVSVVLEWDTGTGNESTYLSLPSSTDEAEEPAEQRLGGWHRREASEPAQVEA